MVMGEYHCHHVHAISVLFLARSYLVSNVSGLLLFKPMLIHIHAHVYVVSLQGLLSVVLWSVPYT